MEATPPRHTLAQLLQERDRDLCQLRVNDPRLELLIAGLSHDSRRVAPQSIFFAYAGRAYDGHNFAHQAQLAGASLVIAARALPELQVPTLLHPDPRALMGRMARAFYNDPASRLKLVAITGTNGKTTTAHLVASMLAAALGQAGLLGTLGAATVTHHEGQLTSSPYDEGLGLTTPEAPELLQQLAAFCAAGVQAVVLEASSIALCEGRLDETPVDVAVLTNISQDHLDYHGTMEAYRAAKAQLFAQHRKPHGISVWPLTMLQQAWTALPQASTGPVLSYSMDAPTAAFAGADVQHVSALPAAVGKLTVITPRGPLQLTSPLFGRFNDENVLAAVAVAEALQLPHQAVRVGLANMLPVPGRLELVRVRGPDLEPQVLVDFAHTPDALARVLAAVRDRARGQVHLVIGCGGDRDTSKRPIMGRVAADADRVWITSDNPRSEDPAAIAQAMVAGLAAVAGARQRCTLELDRRRAIADAVAMANAQDVVLVAGKGHEPYQLIAGTKWPFDDRACARAALEAWHNKGSHP